MNKKYLIAISVLSISLILIFNAFFTLQISINPKINEIEISAYDQSDKLICDTSKVINCNEISILVNQLKTRSKENSPISSKLMKFCKDNFGDKSQKLLQRSSFSFDDNGKLTCLVGGW